jgi:hypothetical protein
MHTLYRCTPYFLTTLNIIEYNYEEVTSHGKHCPQAYESDDMKKGERKYLSKGDKHMNKNTNPFIRFGL